MSFQRRLALMRLVRELAAKHEFAKAGLGEDDQMRAGILSAEVDSLYLQWGLKQITGLLIDGQEATPELLESHGPEILVAEALQAVKQECGLTDEERKN